MERLVRIRQFFLLFSLLIGLAVLTPLAQAAPQLIGQVVWVQGGVQAVTADNQARNLQRRSPIYEKDTIVTSASGSGQIVFTDSSTVSLRGGTTLKIDEYKYTPGSGDNKYISSLAKGGFRTITGLISKSNPGGYQVNTPVATIGVRGTDYAVFFNGAKLSVQLNRGAIAVTNRAGQMELSRALDRIYAEISGLNTAPVAVQQQPIELKTQLPIVPATAPAPNQTTSTSGADAAAAASVVQPTSGDVTTPVGSSTTVSSFCIN